MKRTLLSGCVLGLALSLAACGGGGGGSGGSGGGSASGTTFTIDGMAGNATRQSTPALTNANQTASALASPGSGFQDQLKSGSGFDPWGNGDLVLKVESNGSLTLKSEGQIVTNFKPGDMHFYKKDGVVDFAVMMDTSRPLTFPGLQGSWTKRDALWIGKLDYASFGYWAQLWVGQGRFEGRQIRGAGIGEYDYFYKGKEANYAGNTLSFTGVAAGVADYSIEDNGVAQFGAIPLTGTASLNITNASTGSLVLDFPNFYKLTGSVKTSANGWLSGSFTNLQKQGSASPVDLPTTVSQIEYNEINGRLYGNNPTNPSEAAGHWYLEYETATRYIHIDGVFGVKKK